MTTNTYIQLDSKKYATLVGNWKHRVKKPGTFRRAIDDSADVTYGPGKYQQWYGILKIPITSPGTGWGSRADFLTTFDKKQGLTFYTHENGSSALTVHFFDIDEDSLTYDMFGSTNVFHVPVVLEVE